MATHTIYFNPKFKTFMKTPIIIIGIGELGGEFARGFLRCGYPVYPITRQTNSVELSQQIPDPALVLITVQESELQSTLQQLPHVWKNKIGLLQNELLPRDWQQHKLINPTIAVVWFEKKPAMAISNILYTPVYGAQAPLITKALHAINIPNRLLETEDELLFQLVRKSLYIYTVNICGLFSNYKVGELWHQHQAFAIEIAEEVLSIQEWLTGKKLPRKELIAGMAEGIEDCPDRYCLGRSAPDRLQRVLNYAKQAGIKTPKLTQIKHLKSL